MGDLQQTSVKSSPKSEQDHDPNSSLISDEDPQDSSTSKDLVANNAAGTGEDECAVDDGRCLKPSGSSIKCTLNDFHLFVDDKTDLSGI